MRRRSERRAWLAAASAAGALCLAREALAFRPPPLMAGGMARLPSSPVTPTEAGRGYFASPSRLRRPPVIQMVVSSSSSLDRKNATAAEILELERIDANGGLAGAEILEDRATTLRSTVLPMPTGVDSRQQQPELDEDDLYAEPTWLDTEPPERGVVRKASDGEVTTALDEAVEGPAELNGSHRRDRTKRNSLPPILQKVADKVGKIDESRVASSPEYLSGEVPELYINLRYETAARSDRPGDELVTVVRATGSKTSFLSSAALLSGTALGCGLPTLPAAVGSGAGYLPTLVAALVAWGYMTVSALLTSELLINRAGETGRVRNVGLLELYTSYLGGAGGKLAGVGFLVVSYLVIGVYLSEGGDLLVRLLDMNNAGVSAGGVSTAAFDNPAFLSRALFVTAMGAFLSAAARFNTVQKTMSHVFFPATLLALLATVFVGLPTADFGSLLALENQHPEVVLNAVPLLFMGWTYHGVVPRVVYDLEGNKDEITKAIVAGSTAALVAYGAWITVILGNVGAVAGISTTMAIADAGGASMSLLPSVAVASELAVVTSLTGVDAVFDSSPLLGPKENNKWKVALLTLLPPAIASVALGYYHVDVDSYEVVDYAGIFGSSVLFLILPALMAWQNRYAEEDPPRPLTVRPMVPLGKVTLGSLYKAAGTLIAEQGPEKLGVLEFVRDWLHL